jgi:DNA-binding NtrC family response regulator
MHRVLEHLARVAQAPDTTVLLQGESGTGKGLLARLLHHQTPGRAAGPFVTLTCSGLPAQALERELFGHARRAIAGTQQDLPALVATGQFRRDLFHRLDVFQLTVPPLRERPGDILPLARDFLAELAGRLGRTLEGFTPEAEEALQDHDYPGNIRELKNAVERAAILETGRQVGLASLQLGRPEAIPRAECLGPSPWTLH